MYAKYDMKLFIAAVWVTGLVGLTGCVSQPVDVNANLPLIGAGQLTPIKQLPASRSQAKAIPELTISSGKTTIENVEYLLSKQYLSALGLTCYQLRTDGHDEKGQTRTLCSKDDYWLLFPITMASTAQ